jgi:hypothetical protein
MSDIKEVEVKLTIEEEDKEKLEKQTQLLVTELNELDAVKKAEPSKTGTAPDNARAGEVIAWGQILITFMTSGGLVAAIGALNSWIKGRKKELKIEKNGETKTINASGLNDDEINKLLEWIRQ